MELGSLDVDRSGGAVRAVINAVHGQLATGELEPGRPIRQELLAEQLGLSRQPVREALRILSSEGMVLYRRNAGYIVREMDKSELDQAYRLRKLIESEVLATVEAAPGEPALQLREINTSMAEAAGRSDWQSTVLLNERFHFAIFGESSLDLFVSELRRIWRVTQIYRAVYVGDPAHVDRIIDEHEAMVDAFENGDTNLLVKLHDIHREGTVDAISGVVDNDPEPDV